MTAERFKHKVCWIARLARGMAQWKARRHDRAGLKAAKNFSQAAAAKPRLPAGLKFPKKRKSVHAVRRNSVWVDFLRSPDELPEIVPVKGRPVLEFLHQRRRVEAIACLPVLEYDEPADHRLVERPGGEHAQIVNIARLVALVTGPDSAV